MQNEDIREIVKGSGISYARIARHIGITPFWLCKLMAKPLSHENRLRILDALAELKKERKEV